MIIKRIKFNILLISVILMACSFFLVFDKKNLSVEFHNIYEKYMSLDPGFSSSRNISDQGGLNAHQNILYKSASMLAKLPSSIFYKYNNDRYSEIKEINFLISFKNYKKILNDRAAAIERGYLKNPKKVKGKVIYNKNEYEAQIRLKGDLGDHWLGSERFSLQITLKNGKTIFGLNKFSIHKPRGRQYPYDHSFQNLLRKNGNLGSVHDFARIKVNGVSWGIMNVEENITKQFLEKEGVKDSLVFRFSDDKKWLQYNREHADAYPNYRYSDPKLIATVYRQDKYFEDIIQRKRYTFILEQRLKKLHSQIYDFDTHIDAFLASLTWNNFHTLTNSNSRYYLNPYTLKLEPITMDQGMFFSISDEVTAILDKVTFSESYQQVFASVDENKNKTLDFDILNLFSDQINTELNRFASIFPLDAKKEPNVPQKNIEKIKINQETLAKWIHEFSPEDSKDLSSEMPSKNQSTFFNEHLHVRHYDDGRLLIFNLLPFEVRVEKILFNEEKINFNPILVPGYNVNSYKPYVIKTDLKGFHDGKIKIYSTFNEVERSISAYPTLISRDVYNPLLASEPEKYNFLFQEINGDWIINTGIWAVDRPVVIDGNLIIQKGTHLNFGKDAYLIVKGGINILGTSDKPVILESIESSWKGLYVLGNQHSHSKVYHASFKHMSGVNAGILSLTGGINFYGGSVHIENTKFESSTSEDALNIIESSVNIKNIMINNTISDGFDCDYCEGSISQSNFSNIGGDGLDFSGSKVNLFDLSFKNIKDKALSVGEASSVHLSNGTMTNIGVGIASKDGSDAFIENTSIDNYALFAAMTYKKKDHYISPSSLKLKNISTSGPNPYIRQFNSFLEIEGILLSEQSLDVEDLYSQGVMKK